ncbi:MAG: class I SAM-dependent methyltransferase family protein [Thermoplasmata archaeon]|nr:MAG: class I SAM-dependent methyltransferase family protein [Thermoplasmata archaeon]
MSEKVEEIAVSVRRECAEELRRILYSRGILDGGRKIVDDSDMIIIPVLSTDGLEEILSRFGASIIKRELPERPRQKIPYEKIIENLASVPEEARKNAPSYWEKIGDIVIIKVPNALKPWERELASTYAKVLRAKTVVEIEEIRGKVREQKVRILYGKDTETVHKENGILFKIDVAKIMFSSGNVDERIRMAEIDMGGEVVVDMFAGIGYFTLPVAVHSGAKKVIAYEINPVAYNYLVQNISLNCVEDVVNAYNIDCVMAMEGVADRVIMGYIHDTYRYLGKALRILRGEGIIHYHEAFPNELIPDYPKKLVEKIARESGKIAKVVRIKRVKSYAPGVSHIVLDVHIR